MKNTISYIQIKFNYTINLWKIIDFTIYKTVIMIISIYSKQDLIKIL